VNIAPYILESVTDEIPIHGIKSLLDVSERELLQAVIEVPMLQSQNLSLYMSSVALLENGDLQSSICIFLVQRTFA
jgi:hypothetical protein